MIASVRNHRRHPHPRHRIAALNYQSCHQNRKIYPSPITKSSSSLANSTRMKCSRRAVVRKLPVHQMRSSSAHYAARIILGSLARNARSRSFAPRVTICFTSIQSDVRMCERPLSRHAHRCRRKFYPDKMDPHHQWRHQDVKGADLPHHCYSARNRSI